MGSDRMKGMRTLVLMACLFVSTASVASQEAQRGKPVYPSPFEKHDCTFCHDDPAVKGPGVLRKELSGLCLDCHPDRKAPREHAVDTKPSMTVAGLPLQRGMLTCATCHDPHANPHGTLLRKPPRDLCLSCHPF